MKRLGARIGGDREAGLTLVELLVASAMSVILVGAACAMLISAVRDQPKLSKKDQSITTARYVLERMTREIRNGTAIYRATGSEVSFVTQVRHTICGGAAQESASVASIECRVTYRCTTTACTRTETAPSTETGGTPITVVSGLDSSKVFNYEPTAEEPNFIGITLHIANPEGEGELTVTDGAGLRILDYARS
jgi:type II secretory pathway pseudopilin PulG